MNPEMRPGTEAGFSAEDSGSPRAGGAMLLVLVVMMAGASMLSVLQHAQARETMALRMLQAGVETEAALYLGLETAMRLLSEHTLRFPEDPFFPEEEATAFQTDSGARIHITFRDAQDRFDLNWLSRQGVPRESFEHLFRGAGLRGSLRALDRWSEEAVPLDSVDAWPLHLPEAEAWLAGPLRSHVHVLPAPQTGVVPINVNAVDPDRFALMLGDSLRGWADTVMTLRAQSPLQDTGAVLALLPGPVASALQPYLTTRSAFVEVRVEAEFDSVVASGRTLLRRSNQGEVEVMLCRW